MAGNRPEYACTGGVLSRGSGRESVVDFARDGRTLLALPEFRQSVVWIKVRLVCDGLASIIQLKTHDMVLRLVQRYDIHTSAPALLR